MNRTNSSVIFFLIVLLVLVVQQSCVDHNFPSYTCPDQGYSYDVDVDPIIQTKCAISGCHDGSLGADRNWTNFATFREKALHGDVKHFVVERIMPRPESAAGPLTQEQINIIACWVDAGAQDN